MVVITTALVLILSNRYLDIFEGQDVAATKLVAEAFESGVNLIHSQWVDQPKKGDTVQINGYVVAVNTRGWIKQLNENVEGCVVIWNQVLPDAPVIAVYSQSSDAAGWSVGGGPGLCYFIKQNGEPFDDDKTPYFSYIPDTGKVTRFKM